MTQADRTRLFNIAYGLDNRPRVKIPKDDKGYRQVAEWELLKARMREDTGQLFILISEDELAKLTEEIRECAANDEARVRDDNKTRNGTVPPVSTRV